MAGWVVLGAKGALGRAFAGTLSERGLLAAAFDLPELDITDSESVSRAISGSSPDFVVNCAAWTDVDGAEAEVERSRRVNSRAPGELAAICGDCAARLVHFSTDFVFDGTKTSAYTEEDGPDPICEYGRGKLLGERAVLASGGEHLVVRTAWLYSRSGGSFVDRIAVLATERDELRVVTDQVGSPTYAPDLVRGAAALAEAGLSGLYHFANSGTASRFELAAEVVRLLGLECRLVEATTDEFPSPAKRPAYSVLSTGLFERVTGAAPRHWREALAERFA